MGAIFAFIAGGLSVFIWITATNNCCVDGSFGFFWISSDQINEVFYDKLGATNNGEYYNGIGD